MLVNRLFFHKIILVFILLFYILGLEINLYSYYFIISIISFFSLFFFILIKARGIFIPKNLFWGLIVLYSISSLFFSFLHSDLISLIRAILIFFVFILCFNLVRFKIDIFKYIFLVSLFFALFSWLLIIYNGDFLFWKYKYNRNSSILFDPNYAAILFSVSIIIAMSTIRNLFYKFLIVIFLIVPLFFTYSKGGWLAFIAGMIVYFFIRYRYKILFIVPVFMLFIVYVYIYSLIDLNMFRFEQGLNSRDVYFNMTIDYVFGGMNLFGGGSDILKYLIISVGGDNVSTHNSYLDLIIVNGIVPFFFLIPIFVYAFIKGVLDKNIYTAVFTILFISSLSVVISIGGVGFYSLLYTYSICHIIYQK